MSAEPRVVAEGVSKWFGDARRRLRRQLRRRPGRDRAARPERRRQVDDAPHALRAGRPSQGTRPRARPRPARRHRRHAAASASCRSRRASSSRSRRASSCPALPGCTGCPTRRRPRPRALEPVELDPDDRRRLPTYSKGMRQRVKVAQALVHDPAVVILDEPLTGLDPRQRLHMIDAVPPPRRRGPLRDRVQPRARRGRAVRLAGARHVAGTARR